MRRARLGPVQAIAWAIAGEDNHEVVRQETAAPRISITPWLLGRHLLQNLPFNPGRARLDVAVHGFREFIIHPAHKMVFAGLHFLIDPGGVLIQLVHVSLYIAATARSRWS